MSDSFELTFSRVVENRLKESAPFLMDHAVGFEIKDANREKTKGFGVYAFLIGDAPAYIPIIYNKGRIEGFEMMWLASQKIMVPCVKEWVNVIKDRGDRLFGKLISNPNFRLKGVHRPEAVIYQSGTFPYALKTANELENIVPASVVGDIISYTHTQHESTNPMNMIDGVLEQVMVHSPESLTTISKTAMSDPDYADGLKAFYKDTLTNIFEKAHQQITKKAQEDAETPMSHRDVKVINSLDDPDVHLLSPNVKRLLMKQGSFILDNRTEHSHLFQHKTNKDLSNVLVTPVEMGYHKLLLHDGELIDAWISPLENLDSNVPVYYKGRHSIAPESSTPDEKGDKPHASDRRSVVVYKDTPLKGYVHYTSDLQVVPDQEVEEFEVGKKAISKPKKSNNGQDLVSGGISVSGYIGNGKTYGTNTQGTCEGKGKILTTTNTKKSLIGKETPHHERTLIYTSNHEGIRISPDIISIGNGVKELELELPYLGDKHPGKFDPFSTDIQKTASTGYSTLSVDEFNGVYTTKLDDRVLGRSNKEREFRRLVFDVGLEPGNVREVVKTASTQNKPIKYLVKLTDASKQVLGLTKTAAATREGAVEALSDDAEIASVPETRPVATKEKVAHSDGMLLEDVRTAAATAADTENKDMFDIHTLQGLLDLKEDVGLRRESFLKLLKGMDECGRFLFRLYWNREKLQEQMGMDAVSKLENSLVDNFSSLGELVLFLQTRFTNLHGPFENEVEGELINDDEIDL